MKADVRVPHGTVTVTRGGQLRGRVIAREFLLEDGEATDRLRLLDRIHPIQLDSIRLASVVLHWI